MRRFLTVVFLLLSGIPLLHAQPSNLLHSSYKDKFHFIDSLETDDYIAVDDLVGYIDKMIKWANDNGDKELGGELLLLKYRKTILHNPAFDTGAVRAFQEMAINANKNKYQYLEAQSLQSLGEYYGIHKRNALAFENYIASYNIYSKFSGEEFPKKQGYLFNLSSSYYSYDDNENAIKYLHDALATNAPTNGLNSTINNTLGLCYRKLKNYDSSEWYFRRTYENAIKTNDVAWIGIAAGNIGITYYLQQRYEDAIPLLEKDIDLSLKTTQIKEAAGSMGILGSIYYHKNDLDKAEKLLTEAIRLGESKSFWPNYALAEQLFTQLYKVYAAKNDMHRAYLYADSALVAKDSVVAQTNSINLIKAKEKAELAEHTLEMEKLANQEKLQVLIRDSLVIGILLISVIGVLFINRQRLHQKKLEAEKKNAESELTSATTQLDDFRRSIQEKNQLIEHFAEEIQKLKKDGEQEADPELLSQLERAVILTDEQWENFRVTFEKVHKGFFSSLKKKMPDLTQAEIRFLALTKLKLSSKEMASMLGISMNAIRMYRHRLRKKFELDKDNMIEELVEDI